MEPVPVRTSRTGVVIPIRALHTGNARLAPALDEEARFELAVRLATRVVHAAGTVPTIVVSSADDVLAWAEGTGTETIADPGTGLDAAVAAGFRHWSAAGMTRVIVAHADLPKAPPRGLHRFALAEPDIVTIIPCHRDDGTPVLSVPVTPGGFPFAYGPGSARRHATIARRLGFAVRVIRDPDLGYDVDVPTDLTDLATRA
jgi:2-phospho-L-lactate guanylyltransferase